MRQIIRRGRHTKYLQKFAGKGESQKQRLERESYLDFTEEFVTVKQQNPITTNKPFKGLVHFINERSEKRTVQYVKKMAYVYSTVQ